MTEHVNFKIIYEGQALQSHSMDVRDLAPALLALAKLFDETNNLLNDDKASVRLQVKAHEAGSFEIDLDLIQSIASQISGFLTGDFVTSVINLKELVIGVAGVGGGTFGLFALIRKLKGKKPDKITSLNNGFVKIEFEHETFEIPLNLLRTYQSSVIRNAVEEVLQPLTKEGIDSLKIKEKNTVIETVTKDELSHFMVPELEEEKIISATHQAAYSIVSLAFKEDNKWRLFDGNSTISAIIQDQDFKRKVDQNIISFSKGDILICEVQTTQWKTQDGLKTEYQVLKVIEHRAASKQLFLFDDLDN